MEGPKEKLDTTAVSQPAIYVSSLAAVEKLRATEGQAAVDAIDVAAGLSLGEYTALAFAGAIKCVPLGGFHSVASLDLYSRPGFDHVLCDACPWLVLAPEEKPSWHGCEVLRGRGLFEDGLKLVKLRGESMQAAADAKESGMVSVIGLQSDKVKELCEVGAVLRIPGAGSLARIITQHSHMHNLASSRTACVMSLLVKQSIRMSPEPFVAQAQCAVLLSMLTTSTSHGHHCAATSAVGADKPVQIANYLCPGNYAVSGSKEGCDEVVARGKEFKAR
eukprot:359219-Chlamydomonas_euryale.AAC.16